MFHLRKKVVIASALIVLHGAGRQLTVSATLYKYEHSTAVYYKFGQFSSGSGLYIIIIIVWSMSN